MGKFEQLVDESVRCKVAFDDILAHLKRLSGENKDTTEPPSAAPNGTPKKKLQELDRALTKLETAPHAPAPPTQNIPQFNAVPWFLGFMPKNKGLADLSWFDDWFWAQQRWTAPICMASFQGSGWFEGGFNLKASGATAKTILPKGRPLGPAHTNHFRGFIKIFVVKNTTTKALRHPPGYGNKSDFISWKPNEWDLLVFRHGQFERDITLYSGEKGVLLTTPVFSNRLDGSTSGTDRENTYHFFVSTFQMRPDQKSIPNFVDWETSAALRAKTINRPEDFQ
jgi:hypothetical protein